MTSEQLDEIEKLAAEAPLGEWPEDELWGGEDGFCAQGPYHNCPHGGHRRARDVDACNEVLSAAALADRALLKKLSEQALPLVKAVREVREARDAAGHSAAELMKLLMKAEQERDVARARLSNLLARIHRDGGHYEAKNGTAKAVVDADVSVAQTFAERDEALAEVERLRDVVRQVHGCVDGVKMIALPEAVHMLAEIHKLTKGEE